MGTNEPRGSKPESCQGSRRVGKRERDNSVVRRSPPGWERKLAGNKGNKRFKKKLSHLPIKCDHYKERNSGGGGTQKVPPKGTKGAKAKGGDLEKGTTISQGPSETKKISTALGVRVTRGNLIYVLRKKTEKSRYKDGLSREKFLENSKGSPGTSRQVIRLLKKQKRKRKRATANSWRKELSSGEEQGMGGGTTFSKDVATHLEGPRRGVRRRIIH